MHVMTRKHHKIDVDGLFNLPWWKAADVGVDLELSKRG